MIKLFKPIYHDISAILNSVGNSLEQGWAIFGPKVKQLKKEMSNYLRFKNVIMTEKR